jgi:hypothetical protein
MTPAERVGRMLELLRGDLPWLGREGVESWQTEWIE